MTAKEAIEEMKSYAEHSWGALNESFEAAVMALEKQIPKKVVCEGDDESDWVHCPCCDEILGINESVYYAFCDNNYEPIHCHKCGQCLTL